MSVRARWAAKYNTARLWAAIARRRYMWRPSAKNRAELERRRRQVEQARRVLKRHPHDEPVPAKGIDVSNLQGAIDFKRVRGDGYRFVYVKAGEGDWRDPVFLTNVKNATAAGLKVGAYQFLRPKAGRTGSQEAAMFMARLESAGLGKGDLRPVLDVEATKLDRPGTHAYVREFVNAMKAHGYRPLIYTARWFWEPNVGGENFGCPLWVAGYVKESDLVLPSAWTSWVCWQFTDKVSVAGIRGHVDANRTPDLRKLIA